MNSRAEVKFTGKRKKMHRFMEEKEGWWKRSRRIKGEGEEDGKLKQKSNQVTTQAQNLKPIRNNVYKCSCCPTWSQGSGLLRLKPPFSTFFEGFFHLLLLDPFHCHPLRLLEVPILYVEIPQESSCVELCHFPPPFPKIYTQPNLSLHHSCPSHLGRGRGG